MVVVARQSDDGWRCYRRRKMKGTGVEEGCSTEEKLCPVSSAPAITPATQPEEEKDASHSIDLFTQAEKALSERSPFDAQDAAAPIVSSLPASLVGFLSTHPGSSKRQKKLHFGVDVKSSRLKRSNNSNIWAATEEYFREVTVDDIERLYYSSSLRHLANKKFFSIPFVQNGNGSIAAGNDTTKGAETIVGANGVGSDCGAVVKDECLEVDRADTTDVSSQEQKVCSVSQSSPLCSSLEWLLGSRDKIYLASERPSKKRKLLGSYSGSEKLLVARPIDGNSSLCHVCCLGDMKDSLNRLIVCGSCKVVVHQKCYGVRDDVDGSWLCSWCRLGNEIGKVSGTDGSDLPLKPCVLCPLQGGALKPVYKSGGSAEFAHLFCSQWMPDVFIGDIRLMEPIMNVHGIKENRRKLLCYLCRVKHGPCVRCSNGTCRTSFHPICARVAGNRMEICGNFGCDTVELRAFCSKHSEVQSSSIQQSSNPSVPVGFDPCIANHPVTLSINNHMLNVGRKNGDKVAMHVERTDIDSDNLAHGKLHETGMLDTKSVIRLQPECGDVQEVSIMKTGERNVHPSDYLNFAQILKKLIDRGKVDVKDVASEIGVSPDSLATELTDDCIVPDLHYKIVTWLRNHAHVGTLQNNVKVKTKSAVPSKADLESNDGSGVANLSDSEFPDVAVKMVQSRRITKNNVRILRDNKSQCPSKEISNDDGIVVDVAKRGQSNGANNSSKDFGGMSSDDKVVADKKNADQSNERESNNSSEDSFCGAVDKILVHPVVFQDSLTDQSPSSEGISFKFGNCGFESCQAGGAARYDENENTCVATGPENPHCSEAWNQIVSDPINAETVSSSYVHPFIGKNLMQLQAGVLGPGGREFSSMEASSSAGVCCNDQNLYSASRGRLKKTDGLNSEQEEARDTGILLSPEDEVEGELIYFQLRLLHNAVARKQFSDDLICKVAKRLPAEIDAAQKRTWDAVFANQYLGELRELKKQGRKERRHREAQAVLAAATAAAAASSRISSFRKDSLDESVYQENSTKLNTASVRPGVHAQLVPRAKEKLPKAAVARGSLEKHSDYLQSMSNFSKEQPRSCDVCRRSEKILNPILICSGCKVAVHLDCYHSVKVSTGPWYCDLCVELLSSKCSRAPVVNSWECGLCGGSAGAFKKSTNGQWIHAFCAEWVFESTFRRGQVNLVEGMETVCKDRDVCYICHRKHGVCIKCNYGHCQSTFHAFCARSAGLYMNMKTSGGLLQHKAYCEKHSVEQRTKAETQKHGVEVFKSMKKIRVELERLRLLCERIIKREKLKREFIFCSHDILASKRDTVAFSVLVHKPFFRPDVSSESAMTSLKGNIDGYKSCSESHQRSDDVTVESSVSSEHHIKLPISMDSDQKTVDSSTSQHLLIRNPTDRALFAGKKIPQIPPSVSSHNRLDVGDRQLKHRKHTETFQKELVMTSDQALVKNQQLPKGYVYVPIGCLSNGKKVNQDAARSHEPLERDDG